MVRISVVPLFSVALLLLADMLLGLFLCFELIFVSFRHGTNILKVIYFIILVEENNILLAEILYIKMPRYVKIALRFISIV